MNLLFFQSPHYSLGVSEMQGMLIQYSQFPFKTRVSLLLSQSGVSRHYSHHFLHTTIDLPDPFRSNLTPRTDSPGHTDPPIPRFDRLVSSPGDALLHRVTNGSGEEDVCSSAFVSRTPHTRLGRCACRISPCFSLQHVCPPLRVLPTGVSVSKTQVLCMSFYYPLMIYSSE